MTNKVSKNNKALILAKAHGFHAVVPPKKNRKLPWLYDKQLYKQRNVIERYFLWLKCFGKVSNRYDKLDYIFISTISLDFIFDSLFIWMLSNLTKKININNLVLNKKNVNQIVYNTNNFINNDILLNDIPFF